jgi:hypothetical protein
MLYSLERGQPALSYDGWSRHRTQAGVINPIKDLNLAAVALARAVVQRQLEVVLGRAPLWARVGLPSVPAPVLVLAEPPSAPAGPRARTPEEHHRRDSARATGGHHRRLGLGQVVAGDQHAVSGALAAAAQVARGGWRPRPHRGLQHLDKVIDIDQSPIGRTPRSNPATYVGLFTSIRDLFAQVPESRVRGYQPGRFSFNVKGGRCEACEGDGILKIEMQFLPDVYVPCEVCAGKRYNRETLEINYRGYSIAEVLEMTAEEALEVFQNIPSIAVKLRTLCEVGLGYIHLGSPPPLCRVARCSA